MLGYLIQMVCSGLVPYSINRAVTFSRFSAKKVQKRFSLM